MAVPLHQKITYGASIPILGTWALLAAIQPLPGVRPQQYVILFLLLILARVLPIAAAREYKVTFVASLVFAGTLYVGPWASGALCLLTYFPTAYAFRRPTLWRGVSRELVVTFATLPTWLLTSALHLALPVQRFSLRFFPELTLTAFAFFALCAVPTLLITARDRASSFSDARAAVSGEAVAFVGGLLLTVLLLALQARQALIGAVVFALTLAATVWVVRAAVELPSLRKRVRAMEHLGIQSIDTPDLERLPELLLVAVHDLIQIDRGYVWIADEDGERLHLRAVWPADCAAAATVRIGEGLPGRMAARQRGIVLGDPDDSRWEREVSFPPGAGEPQSVLAIPLRARDRTLGAALFTHGDPRKYGARDLHLVQSIANLVGNALENVRLHREMRSYATTDGMTGLINHRHLQEVLQEEFARAVRYSREVSVIMGDVDSFKAYNDTYGHPIGDELLRRVSAALKAQVRTVDTVARYGGEEFCIILPETGKQQAILMAERLRNAIAATCFPGKTAQQTVHKTMSFGVASFPEDTQDPNQMVSLADAALYRAKRGGRNQVQAAPRTVSPPGPRSVNR